MRCVSISAARVDRRSLDVLDADEQAAGIGALSDARWKSFFDMTVAAGLYPADLDLKRACTLQFVNKRYGLKN